VLIKEILILFYLHVFDEVQEANAMVQEEISLNQMFNGDPKPFRID